jgi:hypothetical protein
MAGVGKYDTSAHLYAQVFSSLPEATDWLNITRDSVTTARIQPSQLVGIYDIRKLKNIPFDFVTADRVIVEQKRVKETKWKAK